MKRLTILTMMLFASVAHGQTQAQVDAKAAAEADADIADMADLDASGRKYNQTIARNDATTAQMMCTDPAHLAAGVALIAAGDTDRTFGHAKWGPAWHTYASGYGLRAGADAYWFVGEYATAAHYYALSRTCFIWSTTEFGVAGGGYQDAKDHYDAATEEFEAGAGMGP